MGGISAGSRQIVNARSMIKEMGVNGVNKHYINKIYLMEFFKIFARRGVTLGGPTAPSVSIRKGVWDPW